MMELIINHKLDIKSNMEQLAVKIKNDIAEKYDIVVTEDSVTESKKLMAEINKEKDAFKKTYKAFKDKVLEPLSPLDLKAKEIEKYYDEARTAVDQQVKKFELKKLEQAKEVCINYLTEQAEVRGVSFQAVNINDLFTQLGSVSATGNISAKAKGEIDNRIQKVENEILKAKLEAEEKAKRDREIVEKARLEAEERARQREAEILAKAEIEKQEALIKAEREKAEAVERAKEEAIKEKVEEKLKEKGIEVKEDPAPVEKTEDGKTVYRIAFVFEVKAKAGADVNIVADKVKNMMLSEQGLKSLKDYGVVK